LRSQELQPFAQALGDLVEVGHTRVGEARVDAAATPLSRRHSRPSAGEASLAENFKVMDATKSMDRKEEGKEEEKGRKEGRKGGKGERKVLGGVWDGHVCLTLSDDG
jgi:hypothetical protein